jgi:hypothetical protein
MDNDAARHMIENFIRRGFRIGAGTALVVAVIVALLYWVSGAGLRPLVTLVIASLAFGIVTLIGLIFAAVAAVTTGVWFDHAETPFEFAIQPNRLKATVWGIFCLAMPVIVGLGSWVVGNPLIDALRHAQYFFILAVIASFVVNSVINSMAHDVRNDPRSKQKRIKEKPST